MVAKAKAKAQKLPPPTPGLSLRGLSLEVLHEYLQLHGLEVDHWYGGQVVVRKVQSDSLVEMAESLAKIGN